MYQIVPVLGVLAGIIIPVSYLFGFILKAKTKIKL